MKTFNKFLEEVKPEPPQEDPSMKAKQDEVRKKAGVE